MAPGPLKSHHRSVPELESVLAAAARALADGMPAVLITVAGTRGSSPRAVGAKMLWQDGGSPTGTIGGGALEYRALEMAPAIFRDGQSVMRRIVLGAELGMCCGGSVDLLFEPIVPAPRLVIYGAGHVGAALGQSAALAGFQVDLVDPRDTFLEVPRTPWARHRWDDFRDPGLEPRAPALHMVTTHDHQLDQDIVTHLLQRPPRWVGLIGSRRKAAAARDRLAHRGIAPAHIARLRCPVGLDIGAETPQEIAISILAELIAVRRNAARIAEFGPTSPPPPDPSP